MNKYYSSERDGLTPQEFTERVNKKPCSNKLGKWIKIEKNESGQIINLPEFILFHKDGLREFDMSELLLIKMVNGDILIDKIIKESSIDNSWIKLNFNSFQNHFRIIQHITHYAVIETPKD